MDDGRETSVQSYIFLILTCHSFEHYHLTIHQYIPWHYIINFTVFPEELNQFER